MTKDQTLADIVLVTDNQELFIHADGLVTACEEHNVVPEEVGVRVRELIQEGFLLAGHAFLGNDDVRYVVRGPLARGYVSDLDDLVDCE